MKKLLTSIVIAILTLALGVAFFAGCADDGKKTPSGGGSEYKIDVESLVLPAAEIGKTYTLSIPDVVDGEGQKMTGSEFEVSVKSVTDPAGKAVSVMGGKYLSPASAGNYTVTYTCAYEGVADATKIFQCIDSQAPTVDRYLISTFALLGQEVPVPEYLVEDNNEIPDENIEIKVIKPDGSSAQITTKEDGSEWFTADVAGEWNYQIKVTDAGDNVVENDDYSLTVVDQDPVQDKIAYLDEEWGMAQVTAFDGRDEELSYVANADLPAGTEELPKPDASELKGALKISPAEGVKASVTISPTIYDWSAYDYIGFWAYNDSNQVISVNIGFANLNQNTLQPKQWQFMAIYCGADQYNEKWSGTQKCDKVVEVALYDELAPLVDGDVYIGGISGYAYDSDSVFAFDTPAGRMHMNTHVAHRDNSGYYYTTKEHEDGHEGSTFFFAIRDGVNVIQERFIKAQNVTADPETTKDFLVSAWIKNPNDKDIKVVTELSTGGKLEEVVKANSAARVQMCIRSDKDNAWMIFDGNPWQLSFFEVYYTDDSTFAQGEGIYLGAVDAVESPVVTAKNVPVFGVTGQAISLPQCDITGEGKEYVTWSAIAPDGTKAAVSEDSFVPETAGEWKFVAEWQGAALAEFAFDVYGEGEEDVIAYFDREEGLAQIRQFSGREGEISFVPNAELPAGEEGYAKPSAEDLAGAVKVECPQGKNNTVVVSSSISDLSQYDYIGFWFYNGGTKEAVLCLSQQNNNNQTVAPGIWQYVTMQVSMDLWSEVWQAAWMQAPSNVVEFILIDDGSDNQNNGPFYFGPIKGGNYEGTDIYTFDQLEGAFHFNPHGGHRTAWDYSFVSDVKDANNTDAEGSFFIESAASSTNSFQMRFIKAQNIPSDIGEAKEFSAYIWINNPNDKAIVVTSDRPSGTYTTTIEANSSGYAQVSVKWIDANAWAKYDGNQWEMNFLTVKYEDGSAFETGTGFYIGAVTLEALGQ